MLFWVEQKHLQKLGVIHSLLKKVNGLIIGGGMAYTFLKAQGFSIGESICENSFIEKAQDIIQECKQKNIKLVLPIDLIVGDDFSNNAKQRIYYIIRGYSSRSFKV